MTSWYPPLTKATVDDFLVVAVLAHLPTHIGSFKLGMTDNAISHFYLARYITMRLSTLAYHLQVNVLAHSDFPFEWNAFEPFFRLLLGHGVHSAKLAAKLNGFLPELEHERKGRIYLDSSGKNVRIT